MSSAAAPHESPEASDHAQSGSQPRSTSPRAADPAEDAPVPICLWLNRSASSAAYASTRLHSFESGRSTDVRNFLPGSSYVLQSAFVSIPPRHAIAGSDSSMPYLPSADQEAGVPFQYRVTRIDSPRNGQRRLPAVPSLCSVRTCSPFRTGFLSGPGSPQGNHYHYHSPRLYPPAWRTHWCHRSKRRIHPTNT